MENDLRIRGLAEDKQEDLKQLLVKALAELIGEREEVLVVHLDKAYRVNSWYARRNNVPRDIVIHFMSRDIRDKVLRAAYGTRVIVNNQEVKVLKELPSKMIRSRKDLRFLTEELRKREISY